MRIQYEIFASNYDSNGFYEDSFQCYTLLAAMRQFRKYKKQRYDIIDINCRYRKAIKFDTSNWDQITCVRGD